MEGFFSDTVTKFLQIPQSVRHRNISVSIHCMANIFLNQNWDMGEGTCLCWSALSFSHNVQPLFPTSAALHNWVRYLQLQQLAIWRISQYYRCISRVIAIILSFLQKVFNCDPQRNNSGPTHHMLGQSEPSYRWMSLSRKDILVGFCQKLSWQHQRKETQDRNMRMKGLGLFFRSS